MARRTPIVAIVLAPLVLYLIAALWNKALVPLYVAVRYSDTFSEWRLQSRHPAARLSAIKRLGSARSSDTALIHLIVDRLLTDESLEVRKAAATALGQIGSRRALTPDAIEALTDVVIEAKEDAMLNSAIAAVGFAAKNNRYSVNVIERIANLFDEKHGAWLYQQAATALGRIGAAQSLPAAVFAVLNRLVADPVRPGEREYLTAAFTEIAKGGRLPPSSLDILVEVLSEESNRRIRKSVVYALAHAAAHYPRAPAVLRAATRDQDPDVVKAAEHGLRIVESKRVFADTDPLALAMDATRPAAERLQGLRAVRGTRIEQANYAQLASLAHDGDTEVAVAALGIFRYLGGDPGDDFDRNILIPELTRAMTHADPKVRKVAFGALSSMSTHRPNYLRAADFPERLEAGADDSDPKVRLVVLVTMLRAAGGAAASDEVIARALADPDPYVRANGVSWLGSPNTKTGKREAFIAQAMQDPDADVRATAVTSEQTWGSRKRAWPIEIWQRWRSGERTQVGMTILAAVTIAAPILICGAFLLYYMARLLTYVVQRRWRAAAVIPVLLMWTGASYGMGMLYFLAGHAGNSDTHELLVIAGILWIAVALYAALGWGMHYAVRR